VALAAEPAQAVEVFVNDNQVTFDAAPFIKGGRTLANCFILINWPLTPNLVVWFQSQGMN